MICVLAYFPSLSGESRALARAELQPRDVTAGLSTDADHAGAIQTQGADQTTDLRTVFDLALQEFDEGQQVLADQPDRARRLFRSAAARFESLIAAGVTNGRLEYNLGNAYLQAGDLGRAILHYRRAQRLIPRDPMLADNLAEARSRRLTTIRPTRRSEFLKNVFFWHYQTTTAARTRAALVLYLLFWGLMVIKSFVPRRIAVGLALICFVLGISSAASVVVSHWTDRHTPAGVVITMDVVIYKGPGSGYQRQFEQPLQPGVEFTVLQTTGGGWRQIRLADGKTGWIERSQAELVAEKS